MNLNKAYQQKDYYGLSAVKTYYATVDRIYIEEGYNIRELNQDHIRKLEIAYDNGDPMPAIVVEVTELGLKVIDGHHRYTAACNMKIAKLEVKYFDGDEAQKMAFMIGSSEGLPLTTFERAEAYGRLQALGKSQQHIVEITGRSKSDVKNHLTFLNASQPIKDAVKSGQLGFAAAVEEINKNGEARVLEAIATGKKVTRKTFKSWGIEQYKAIMIRLANGEDVTADIEKFKQEVMNG